MNLTKLRFFTKEIKKHTHLLCKVINQKTTFQNPINKNQPKFLSVILNEIVSLHFT
jgi:hypothetical protein